MRRVICLCLLSISIYASAQDLYLLPQFTQSICTLKGDLPLKEYFNYNCNTGHIEFINGKEVLQLVDEQMVDTLYLGEHKLSPYKGRFIEKIAQVGPYSLYIDYTVIKKINGKKGAYGINTNAGGVYTVDIGSIQTGGDRSKAITDITVRKNSFEPIYYLEKKGIRKLFKDAKQLKKLIPEKNDNIINYLKDKRVNFKEPSEVIELLSNILK